MRSSVGSSPLRNANTVSPKLNYCHSRNTCEFKGMLWGQPIKVFTDQKNLTRDALGLTLDRVYRWRLLLEEYGPEIVYIKGIHNTVADAISRLEYDPSVNKTAESYLMTKVKGNSQSVQRQNWLTLSNIGAM